ncbi:caspase family protein [Scytonema hofmannii FACHB-248]|uniref:Caspase family protein n=1 Tax=Scytonema hofmannii FACHB-248 TaxID=1842502 RepID=A0ABR8GP30_9CYAN|nr:MULTISPECIES: NB-ARC domain-containing protein [Nostocales]MBD2604794.1 caspase family protein [Scytonema hofmannii FACHB-248]
MRRDALVVGINQYPFLKDTPTSPAKHLTTPAADAEAIAQLLEEHGDFRVKRLPESFIDGKLQVDPHKAVHANELVNAVTKLFIPEDSQNTALLFFAGHGLLSPLGNLKQTILASSDAGSSKNQPKGLLLRDLWDILQRSPVIEQIIWLDSCFSGELINFNQINITAQGFERTRFLIAASHSSEVAYQQLDGRYGLLSGALQKGLDPYQMQEGDWITDLALAHFVDKQLEKYYLQTKIYQKPEISKHGKAINLIKTMGKSSINREDKEGYEFNPINAESLKYPNINKSDFNKQTQMEQQPYSQDFDTKKSQLKKLEKNIEDRGGMSKCPENMLQNYLELRREISLLEEKISSNETSISGSSSKYSIPSPIQFIERPQEQQFIEEALKSQEKWVRNIVIRGMGGTGKTILAAEAARKVEGLFRKVIWASANDSPIDLADLLDIVLRAIGYRSDQLTMLEKQEKVSELLRQDRYLLVVDSFERIGDKEVDRFLAENNFYPSKVLITTRHILPRDYSVINLEGFKFSQTHQMLKEIGKNQGLKQFFSENDVQNIHDITSGLPLAIQWIIGQLSQKIPLEYVLRNLTNRNKQQGNGITGNESQVNNMLESIFGNSWDLLKKATRRILMSMTFFTAPASEEAIQVISGVEPENFQSEIEYLIKMSLIQPNRDRMGGEKFRFSIHPLTRSFAGKKVDDDIVLKRAIYSEAVRYFIVLMEKLARPGLGLDKYEELEQDLPNCLSAFSWCRNQREFTNTFKIVDSLNHFLFERGFWDTRIQICTSASELEHDSPSKDYEAAWRSAFGAGWVCCRQNNYEEAKKWLVKAQENLDKIPKINTFITLYTAKISQLNALIFHGEAMEQFKRDQSNSANNKIERLFRKANDYHDNARLLMNLYIENKGTKWTFEEPDYAIALIDSNQGDLAMDMGYWKNEINQNLESRQHYESAQKFYSKVLENAQKSQWQNREALIAFSAANLGHVEILLQEKPIEEIRHRFDEALKIAEFIGRTHTIAWCYRGYGLLEQRSSETSSYIPRKESKLKEAENWLKKALEIFERIGRRERVAETRESLKEVETSLVTLLD